MMVHFLLCSNDHKLSALVFLLKRIGLNEATIIFASTKYLVDLIVYTLEKFGISAVNIYGKMDATDRRDQLQLVLLFILYYYLSLDPINPKYL